MLTVSPHTSSTITNGTTVDTDNNKTIAFAINYSADAAHTANYDCRLKLDGNNLEYKSGQFPGGVYSYAMPKIAWQQILNGNHIFTLTVTIGGKEASSTISFTKEIFDCVIISDPIGAVEISNNDVIRKFMLFVNTAAEGGVFPDGVTIEVQVTNNALDDDPSWYTLTPSDYNLGNYADIINLVTDGTISPENGNYFAFRVHAYRNTAVGDCNISEIFGTAGQSQVSIIGGNVAQLQIGLEQEISDREAGDNALQEALQAGLQGVLKFKGSVDTYEDLPIDTVQWDLWKTTDTGNEWYWDGNTWDNLDFTFLLDTAPIEGSINPISSGGVYTALENVQPDVSWDAITGKPPLIEEGENWSYIRSQAPLLLPQPPDDDVSARAATTLFVHNAISDGIDALYDAIINATQQN
jgi:hypothetical protein